MYGKMRTFVKRTFKALGWAVAVIVAIVVLVQLLPGCILAGEFEEDYHERLATDLPAGKAGRSDDGLPASAGGGGVGSSGSGEAGGGGAGGSSQTTDGGCGASADGGVDGGDAGSCPVR